MYTYNCRSRRILDFLARSSPSAVARICGCEKYPSIQGTLLLYSSQAGVFAVVSVDGIPDELGCGNILAMHIHDPETGAHYNPANTPHPHHAGDMPPIFVERNSGWAAFLTERFDVREVMGKEIVLHRRRDDFTTQPSGDAGEKIACGKIAGFIR
ncbi:MAG: superoxide dismutase family protein [Ruminococcaceae bacterium]|nr:superoxide dismutase family protein [Oscillospiraceae bacterium]